jgi:hypothetical protein
VRDEAKLGGVLPISSFVERVNSGQEGAIPAVGARPFHALIRLHADDPKPTRVLVMQPLSSRLLGRASATECYLALLSPVTLSSPFDLERSADRMPVLGDLGRVWLWWLEYTRGELRKLCWELERQDGAAGATEVETRATKVFRDLVRLHSVEDLIRYASAGLRANRHQVEEQDRWLDESVLPCVTPAAGRPPDECWHNCLDDHWPPCHEGRRADARMAETLIRFCPWTSGARAEADRPPTGLELPGVANEKRWDDLLADRLWGWGIAGDDGVHPVEGYVDGAGVDPQGIDEHSLQRLLAAEYLGARLHEPCFSAGRPQIGSRERGRCAASVGRVLQCALGHTALDWQTIEALVWMIAEYGHGHLGIDPRLDIASHLLHAARAEPALHAMQAYYRDHFFHAIEVCFLGHLLLITQDESGKRLWEHVLPALQTAHAAADPNGGPEPRDLRDVLRQWYVAALFHDVGYAIEVLHAARGLLGFYRHSPALATFRDALEEAVKELSAALVKEAVVADLKGEDKPGEDHAVVGAHHLRGLLDKLGRDHQAGFYGPAIHAIAVHNNERLPVHFNDSPLAFLLVLCDAIQEWNRAHLRHSTAPSMLLARLLAGDEPRPDATGPLSSVALNVERGDARPSPRPVFRLAEESCLEIELKYDQDIQTDAGVFSLWIGTTANLQRLSLGNLPFNVRITFRTPWFRLPGQAPRSQMHRLRDAAADTHMNFLRRWFPVEEAAAGTPVVANPTGAVLYSREDDPEWGPMDVLTLDVGALTGTKIITAPTADFYECLQSWKHFCEDRHIEGDYTPRVPGGGPRVGP